MLFAQILRENTSQVGDGEAPVVGVQHRVEAGGAQVQLEPQVREEDGAERHDARLRRQAEHRQPPDRDVDRIDPQNVVRQRAPPAHAELRSHDSRNDEHAPAAIDGRAARGARQAYELAVLVLAEVGCELVAPFAAREQLLDFTVAPGEAVVRRDVIVRGVGSDFGGHTPDYAS
jgi:hypothetical protein